MSEERDLLAAEHALRLLEGEELAQARSLETSEPGFAAAVAAWQERLMPLGDEAGEEQPPAHVWTRVQEAIAEPAARSNVVPMRRKLAVWRGYGAAVTALAASLAFVMITDRREQPAVVVPQPAPVLVATLSSPETEASLSVAYDGARRSLLVTPARLGGEEGRDHELWIIPAGGTPVSLGLVRPGEALRLPVPADVAPHFRRSAAIAVSLEPAGGSPTGQPTGPVLASGELLTI